MNNDKFSWDLAFISKSERDVTDEGTTKKRAGQNHLNSLKKEEVRECCVEKEEKTSQEKGRDGRGDGRER